MPRVSDVRANGAWEARDAKTGALLGSGAPLMIRIYSARADIVRALRDKTTGWRPPLPYNAEFTVMHYPEGKYFTSYNGGNGIMYTGNLQVWLGVPIVLAAPGVSTGLRSRAEVEALLALKDQKINLAQAFAERGQVASFVAGTATSILKSYRAMKKGKFGAAASALGLTRKAEIPKRWLEWKYAVKPLLSDVYGACEAIGEWPIQRYRISVEGKSKERDERISYAGANSLPCVISDKTMSRCKVRLDYHPGYNAIYKKFSETGISNPALLAWELMPLSFVADWFVPVGDWLNSLDAASGLSFLAGSCSEYSTSDRGISGYQDSGFGWSSWSGCQGGGSHRLFKRTIYNSSPIPSLPRWKSPWSYDHVANACSLLALAMHRK